MVWSVKADYLKRRIFMLKKRNRLHQQLSTRKKSVREIYTNKKDYCFNFLFLFKKMEDSFMIHERYINEKKPGCIIQNVRADGLCVIRSFQEGLKICYQNDVTIAKLRNEVLHNYNFYSEFSSNEVNILTELGNFLKNPLKYYNSDTVDLLLMAPLATRINAELLFMNAPKLTHGLTTYVKTKRSTKEFFISQKLNCHI